MENEMEKCQKYINKLRGVANFYEKHPEVKLPWDVERHDYVYLSWEEMEHLAKILGVDISNENNISLSVNNGLTFSAHKETLPETKYIKVNL